MKIELLLKSMCYRSIGQNTWVKPFGATLLVFDFPETDTIRLTQWFLGSDDKMNIWKSHTCNISEVNQIKHVQQIEMDVFRNSLLGINSEYEKIVPPLTWTETFDFL